MRIIDLRSDTVTKPTPQMRQAMASALVGDDVYQEDPTVIELETKVAQLFGKEAALFFPTGTMANLTALMAWCPNRGSEVIVGDKSHIFLYEQTGACQYGGISLRTVPNNDDGTMNLYDIKKSIREEDIHEPETCLICIENTHNACGGKVLPLFFLQQLKSLSASTSPKTPIHMDGARIWNALTAMNLPPSDISAYVDSITVCLSKGLGCPAGSMLIGSKEFIQLARRIRKSLGGGMRQSGILAAAGLVAIEDFQRGILAEDHRRAKTLIRGLSDIYVLEPYDPIETNIVFLQLHLLPYRQNNNQRTEPQTAKVIVSKLKEKGGLVSDWAMDLLRMVIHRDITDEDIQHVIHSFQEIYNMSSV
jgi:threonine aldolase